jgi:hypothetical protein
MYKLFDPEIFIDQKFTLKSNGKNDHQFVIADHTAGRIFRLARAERTLCGFGQALGRYVRI